MKSRNPPLSILVADTKGLNLLGRYILRLLRSNWEKLFVKLTVELTVKYETSKSAKSTTKVIYY